MNHKIPIWIPIVIVLLFILSGFGGSHFYRQLKSEYEDSIKENEALIEQSKLKQDSLINIAENERNYSDILREDNERLQQQNNSLYYELKKRNQQVFIIDTSFIYNARRISESSNRFYKENDTIR